MRVFLVAVLAAVSLRSAGAQQPAPNTEIYLATLGRDAFPLTVGAARDISNNPGWDNQPSFTPDGKAILFSSMRDGKQRDIYRYDIATQALTQLTHTPESEYSPLVTPDGKTFSVIRVEADGTQRLWRFDLDGSNPRLVLENVKPVGYQAWLDATHVAVFVLGGGGQPSTLQVADTATGTATIIDQNPGHGLAIAPGDTTGAGATLTYVCKTDPGHWIVKEFNPTTRAVSTLADALPGSEDLAWDPIYVRRNGAGGRLFMAKGATVYLLMQGEWRPQGDFSKAGLDRITRLAINPDRSLGSANRLVFVAEPTSK